MENDSRDPTQDELDFLLCHDFIWLGMGGNLNSWLFENEGHIYDLSAANILQIDEIKEKGLFITHERKI